MNKTLEFYRKLAEAYKGHGGDCAVAELWTALERAVSANTELVEALEEIYEGTSESWAGNIANEAIRKAKGD